MSERDLRRIEVLSDVRAGRRTIAAAALLAISERQAYRLLVSYQPEGGSGLIHKERGRCAHRASLRSFERTNTEAALHVS